jgi:molybdenum cofactor guanylyltransferase
VNEAIAIAILAGGRATRFPGKLERTIDGRPMLAGVYEGAVATGWPVYLIGSPPLLPAIEGLDARTIADSAPGTGPLQALAAACAAIQEPRVLALAGDEPYVDAALMHDLERCWVAGDEAVVPRHDGGIEPLAALYDRRAVLRESSAAGGAGASMHALIRRLRVRYVPTPQRYFANVNTPDDFARVLRERA